MDNGDQELRLGFSADTSPIASATSALKDYLEASDAVAASQDALASSADDAGQALQSNLSDTFAQLRSEAKDTSSELDDLRDSIKGVKDESNEDDGGGSSGLGGSRRFLGAVGGLANRVDPGAGAIFSGLGDVTEITKDYQKFGDVITGLGPAGLAAAAAIGIISAGLVVLAKDLQNGEAALKTAIDADNKYYQNVATLTSAQVELQVNALKQRNLAIEDQIRTELHDVEVGKDAIVSAFSGIFDAVGTLLGTNTEALLKDATANIVSGDTVSNLKKLNDEFASNNDLIAEDTGGLKENAFAANDAAQATAALTAQMEKYAQDGITAFVDTSSQIADLIKKGTTQQLDDAIAATQKEIDSTKLKITEEYAHAAAIDTSTKAGVDAYNATGQAIQDLQAQQTNLQKSLNALSDGTVRAYTEMNDAAAKQAQLVKDSAAIDEKYQQDKLAAEDQYQSDTLKTQADYYAKITDLAEQATKQAADLLEKLNEKDADLQTKLQQNEADDATKLQQTQLDDTIKFQRSQEQLAQSHQDKLNQIIKDAQEQQANLILNRDFSGLFNLKKTTDDKIQAENDQYAEQRQNQIDAFNNQEDDEKRHYAEQEQQRLVDYNRQVQQAQLQYQRQSAQDAQNNRDALNKAYQAEQDQLNALADKHAKELQLLQDNAVASLNLLSQTDQQKLDIESQYYQDSLQLLRDATASVASGVTGGAASGGGGNVNFAASLNGPNYRGNAGGSSTVNNHNNQSATVNIPISGASNPAGMQSLIKNIVQKTLDEYLNP